MKDQFELERHFVTDNENTNTLQEKENISKSEQISQYTLNFIDKLVREHQLRKPEEKIKIDGLEQSDTFQERVKLALTEMADLMTERFDANLWNYHNIEHVKLTCAVAFCIVEPFLELSKTLPGLKAVISEGDLYDTVLKIFGHDIQIYPNTGTRNFSITVDNRVREHRATTKTAHPENEIDSGQETLEILTKHGLNTIGLRKARKIARPIEKTKVIFGTEQGYYTLVHKNLPVEDMPEFLLCAADLAYAGVDYKKLNSYLFDKKIGFAKYLPLIMGAKLAFEDRVNQNFDEVNNQMNLANKQKLWTMLMDFVYTQESFFSDQGRYFNNTLKPALFSNINSQLLSKQVFYLQTMERLKATLQSTFTQLSTETFKIDEYCTTILDLHRYVLINLLFHLKLPQNQIENLVNVNNTKLSEFVDIIANLYETFYSDGFTKESTYKFESQSIAVLKTYALSIAEKLPETEVSTFTSAIEKLYQCEKPLELAWDNAFTNFDTASNQAKLMFKFCEKNFPYPEDEGDDIEAIYNHFVRVADGQDITYIYRCLYEASTYKK
ncbi:MAG: hypothetical protein OHK0017_09470 [Patescibacteria group bacterium]